jgi:hypothetical protein
VWLVIASDFVVEWCPTSCLVAFELDWCFPCRCFPFSRVSGWFEDPTDSDAMRKPSHPCSLVATKEATKEKLLLSPSHCHFHSQSFDSRNSGGSIGAIGNDGCCDNATGSCQWPTSSSLLIGRSGHGECSSIFHLL